jgi:hypothetical protein
VCAEAGGVPLSHPIATLPWEHLIENSQSVSTLQIERVHSIFQAFGECGTLARQLVR